MGGPEKITCQAFDFGFPKACPHPALFELERPGGALSFHSCGKHVRRLIGQNYSITRMFFQ